MSPKPDVERIREAAMAETLAHHETGIPIVMDLATVVCVVAALQLALRHPRYQGPSAARVRSVVGRIIEHLEDTGFPATAAMLRLGDWQEYDT